MKSLFKKTAALLLALSLVLGLGGVQPVYVHAEEAVTSQAEEGKDFLRKVIGEYQPLFEGASFESKYDHYWHDYSAAIAGESMADMCVAMMKQAIGAKVYGPDAGEEFFCGFTEDVVKIEFGGSDGTVVTFTKANGKKIKHTYSYVKDAAATGFMEGQDFAMPGYLYKSADGNKDEFTYLYMCPDTPETTYHLEFRYGDTEENMLKLTDGKYKNWLAAAVQTSALTDPAEEMMQKVIALFVLENVGAMSGDEAAAQRVSMSGVWSMDTSILKDVPSYENAELTIQLSKAGQGKSYVDMTGSGEFMLASEYPYFIYANEKTDKGEAGVYIVESDDEGIKTATYEISEKDGKKELLFHSSEGDITYFYQGGIAPDAVNITKAKAKGGKVILKWKGVENADGYVIVYSTSKKFMNAEKITVTGKNSAKIKKLDNKKYYIKVCAFTNDASGEAVYGEYSKVKKVKVK